MCDSRHIVLHSDWRTRREVLVIDTEARGTAAIRRLRVPAPLDTVRISPAFALVPPSRLGAVPVCAALLSAFLHVPPSQTASEAGRRG